MKIRKVSILTPIHNEEANLKELVERVGRVMEDWRKAEEGRDWEHLACDDHSTDHSLELLQTLAGGQGRLKPLRNPVRSGQTGGFATGFKHATGDVIVTMDADLQVFPEDIPLLLAPLEEGRLDLSNAIRMNRRHSRLLILISRLGNHLIRLLMTCPVRDAASNFTALPARWIRSLPLIENDHRYLIPILIRRGLDPKRIGDVPVRHAPRRQGTTKYKAMQKALRGLPELWRCRKRLKAGFYGPGGQEGGGQA
jgi:glycosyltransferase involved in cell wall biosynthesis